MRGEYSKIKAGEVFPGELGGVIAPMATDGKRVFVPVVNHSMTVAHGCEVTEESEATGEVVAHRPGDRQGAAGTQNSRQPAYGAPLVVNDLVFATTCGRRRPRADAESGRRSLAGGAAGRDQRRRDGQRRHAAGPGRLPVAEGQTAKLVAFKLE